MAGKGDTPRPVDPQKWAENWERIFRQPKPARVGLSRSPDRVTTTTGRYGTTSTTAVWLAADGVPVMTTVSDDWYGPDR